MVHSTGASEDWLEGCNRNILEKPLVDITPVDDRVLEVGSVFGGEDRRLNNVRDIIPDMEQFRVDKLLHPSPSVGLGPGVDDVRGQEHHGEKDLGHHVLLLHGGLLVLSLELRESLILGIQLD